MAVALLSMQQAHGRTVQRFYGAFCGQKMAWSNFYMQGVCGRGAGSWRVMIGSSRNSSSHKPILKPNKKIPKCAQMPVQTRGLSSSTMPSHETMQFLLSLGYTEAVSSGIINALLQNGIPPSSLFTMVKGLAGRYEVGEDGGLEALAASVKLELEKQEGKATVKIWCLPSTGWSPASDEDAGALPTVHSMERAFAVEALEGVTLTDIVNHGTGENSDVLAEYLECACSGIMACSTCHVVIHPDWYDATQVDGEGVVTTNHSVDPKKIGPPSEAELDMIDLAYEPQLTSRLGCQVQVTKELDGLVVLLPAGSNNLMDFVPFE